MRRYVVTVPVTFQVEVLASSPSEAKEVASAFRGWSSGLALAFLREEQFVEVTPPEGVEGFMLNDDTSASVVRGRLSYPAEVIEATLSTVGLKEVVSG